VIGVIITHYSYNPLWWYAGTLYPLAFLFFLWFIPRIEYKDLSIQAS
jgi:ACS family hexuronate transporter-like MFS transporter